MASGTGTPVIVVENGGKPVVQVTGLGQPGVVTTNLGVPITLVENLGTPMILVNEDGSEYSSALYVSNDGDDGDVGTLASPLETLAAAMSAAAEGQTIRLNRGDVWREVLTIPEDGLTITNYGSGDLPVISGANVVTGLVQEEEGSPNVLFSAGLETGDLSEFTATTAGGTGAAIASSTDQAATGSRSLKITGDTTSADNRTYATCEFTAFGAGTREITFKIRYAAAQLEASSWLRADFYETGTQRGYWELQTSAGSLINNVNLWSNLDSRFIYANTSVGTALAADTWHTITFRITAAASGSCEVLINGVSLGVQSGDTDGMAAINRIRIGNSAFGRGFAANGICYFDDISVTEPVAGDADRWTATVTTEPSQVFIDGVRGLRQASAGDVDTYRYWHWAANVLTVYGDAEVEPDVEASIRATAVDLDGASGVTLDGLRLERALVCVDGDDASGLTITNSEVADAFVEGIKSISSGTPITDLAITDNEISGCGGTGIQFNMHHDGVLIDGNTIHHCCQMHEDQTGGHARQEFSAGIKFWGDEENDVFLDVAISNNNIYDMVALHDLGSSPQVRGVGIWGDHYYFSAPSGYPVLITGNAVARCQSNGIYLEKTEATRVTDCATLDSAYGASGTGTTQFRAGIMVESNDAPSGDCIGNLVDHCTNSGGFWGIGLNSGATANVLSTNAIRDCVSVGAGADGGADGLNLYASDTVNDTTHGIGNTVANCNLGADRASIARWPTTTYSNVATMDTAVAAISGMISGDTVFVNAAGDDYRLDTGSPGLNAGTDGFDIGASDAVLIRLEAIA